MILMPVKKCLRGALGLILQFGNLIESSKSWRNFGTKLTGV